MRIQGLQAINQRFFYHDRVTVHRTENAKQPNGSTKQAWQAVKDLKDIPCRLSMDSQDDNLDQRDDQNPVLETGTLFCDPAYPLEEGAMLEIVHEGQAKRWIAGAPAKYPHCQQIKVVRRDRG